MSGGAGNPDVTAAIAAMAGQWYRWIAVPYTDIPNIVALEAELATRYSATVQQGGRAFAAITGSHAATLAYGAVRNSPHISMLGMQGSPTWCRLPQLSIALFDGISTYTVDDAGTCHIEAAITQYQTNAAGVDDSAYLYINTPETLEQHRYNVRAEIALRYPRHKLAADSQPVAPGQPIARPKDIKAAMRAVYQREVDAGIMEQFQAYADSLYVEIDPNNPNRVNVVDQPNLVNQLRVFANLVQFRV